MVQDRLESEKLERDRAEEKLHCRLDLLRVEPDTKEESLAERAGVEKNKAKDFIYWLTKKGVLTKDVVF